MSIRDISSDVLTNVLTFLDPKEEHPLVCQEFNRCNQMAQSVVLREWESLPEGNIFRRAVDQLRREHPRISDKSSFRWVTRQVGRALWAGTWGFRLRGRAKYVYRFLSGKELTNGDKNRAAEEINQIRAGNLISFAESLGPFCPEITQFCRSLPPALNPREIAREIRAWMRANPDIVRGITGLALSEINVDEIPAEAALLVGLPWDQISDRMELAWARNFPELLHAFISSPRFPQILLNKPSLALWAAASAGHIERFREVLRSPQFAGISNRLLGYALSTAAQNGNDEIMALLIESNRFNDIPVSNLGAALLRAAANKHSKAMNVLIRSRRFAEIREDACRDTLDYALFNLRLNVIKDLVDALGVAQLSERGFQMALWGAAAKEGPSGPFDWWHRSSVPSPKISEKILRILIESPRFQQARNITRQHALSIALKDGETEKVQMLIEAGVRLPLMKYLPARLLHAWTALHSIDMAYGEVIPGGAMLPALLLLFSLVILGRIIFTGNAPDTPSF